MLKVLSVKRASVSILQSYLIGTVVAVADSALYPFTFFKSRLHTGTPIPFNPRIWYRGVGMHFASYFPAMQLLFVTENCVSEQLKRSITLSDSQAQTAGFIMGGGMMALSTCPLELVMVRQSIDKEPLSVRQVVRNGWQSHGARGFYRGLMPTVCREVPFCGMVGMAPYTKHCFPQSFNERNPQLSSVCADALGGALIGSLTNPFDLVKTRMQTDAAPMSFREGMRAVYRERGLRGLFKGGSARSAGISGAIVVMGEVHRRLTDYFLNQ